MFGLIQNPYTFLHELFFSLFRASLGLQCVDGFEDLFGFVVDLFNKLEVLLFLQFVELFTLFDETLLFGLAFGCLETCEELFDASIYEDQMFFVEFVLGFLLVFAVLNELIEYLDCL